MTPWLTTNNKQNLPNEFLACKVSQELVLSIT